MKILWSAAMALGLAGAAWAAGDDEANAPKPAAVDDSYFNLLDRVARLEEKQQEDELERLKKMAAQEKEQEKAELPARVSKVEKGQAKDDELHAFKKWLSFESPDGNFTAKVGGRIYFVYRHIFNRGDGVGGAPDSFIMDTARIQLDGTFFKDFYYRVENEAKTGSAYNLNDCYVGWSGLKPYVSLQGGQFKVPFSQEETTSSRFIDFAERSLVNRFIPSRDIGLMLYGDVGDKIFEWWLGVFDGNTKNAVDTNDEKDLAVRIFVTPLRNSDMSILKQFRLGFDLTVGDHDGPGAQADITDGDLGGITIFDFNANTYLDGLRTRYNIGLSWLYGPASLRGEYMVIKQELVDAAPKSSFQIKGFNVQGTFLLTGEEKALENRVKPKNNLNPLEGGWGAFELAARYAMVDVSDAEDAGLIAATANQKTSQVTVGLNWWWTSNMCVRINWEHLMFDEDLAIGKGDSPEGTQDIFYVRWQVDF